jgi:hypothetical protein
VTSTAVLFPLALRCSFIIRCGEFVFGTAGALIFCTSVFGIELVMFGTAVHLYFALVKLPQETSDGKNSRKELVTVKLQQGTSDGPTAD